ncbi:ribonuclease H2 subunit C-like [Actinia tenebrosa]|uniref:Ribonuclease H2 subunit C-like n=1 Tax=Actinia tenebrosa TaxID=6105 RepID=A0A6P8IKN4_ACTTE|nr:ribonuclease H2 subunit C-like [Actinia tenebrosa]
MSGSGNVVVNSSSLDSAVETTRIHLMPCTIHHNGDADVASYFDPIVDGVAVKTESGSNTNDKDLSGSFRGRILKGTTVSLPVGYNGYVLKEDRKPYTDEEDRTLRATHKFSQFNYWNLETPPSENDAMTKAMQWIDIASALHGNEDDIQNATPDTIR